MKRFSIKNKIKCAVYFPLLLPHILAFKLFNTQMIVSDLKRWKIYRPSLIDENHMCLSLVRMLVLERTFRNQFYMRVGLVHHILKRILCQEGSVNLSYNVEPGLCLIHAYSTIMNYDVNIGNNCTILHSVTIGGG